MQEGIAVKSFILKPDAFKEDGTLHIGLDNCCYRKDKYHLFLDCDDVLLRKLFDGIEAMKTEFKELEKEKFLILNTSLNHFSLAAFPISSWNRYVQMLWSAVDKG